MNGLKIGLIDVERIRKSIDLTRDRILDEGHANVDDGLETLADFCTLLVEGGNVDEFLSDQDMEVPTK